MAKPIFLIKVESGLLTPDQIKKMGESLKENLNDEYHPLCVSHGAFKGLTFEVLGVKEKILSGEDLKVTFDRTNDRLGRV